jgi:2-oxoglutarate/2-oxoacid ferredoxin oxidoreductase subunit alpha
MATADVLEQPQQSPEGDQREVVNDFTIEIATVNGSGSQTANGLLARAAFKMGIPVGAKNLFPSNISGLPTWYTIRLSRHGYTARRGSAEVLVAFNPATAQEDYARLASGGICFHPDDIKFLEPRDDVVEYALPVKELMKQAEVDPKLRDHVANMVYVGGLAFILGIDVSDLREGLLYHFKGKQKPVDMNMNVVNMTIEWAKENLQKSDPYRVEPMEAGNQGLIMIDGNSAAALGSVFGGVTVGAWYPITPSTSLFDALAAYLPKLRPGEENTYAVVQAEDELAAIGMVLGAGWAGARAMTSTSGPGISLMTEFTGYGYFAEIPGVIWDIQRVGPSTGLPTRTSQGDVLSTYYLGHGDTRHVILLPGNMKECFEFGWRAFDLAERLQTPVFVLSDLDLGMNVWMSEPFEYPDQPMDRGKVLSEADLVKLEGKWARYEDIDGDAIPYRTLPGNTHPAAPYFTRGTGHNAKATYSERPDDWEQNLLRLERKHETARTLVPKPEVDMREGAEIGIIAYGSTDPAIVEGRDILREAGVETSYLRLKALPLEETVTAFINKHKRVYVVELNVQGQMRQLLQLHVPERAVDIRGYACLDGLPLTASMVRNAILEQEQK